MKQSTKASSRIEKEFTSIFDTYSGMICKHLYKKYGDYNKAEDIVQDTFVTLWNNRDQVSYDKVKAYLYVVANNGFKSTFRNNKYQNKLEESNPAFYATKESPDYLMEEEEFSKKLQAALHSLSPKQSEVFIMSRLEKMTYAEISEKLNISIKAVEKRMQNALLIMKTAIGLDIKNYKA